MVQKQSWYTDFDNSETASPELPKLFGDLFEVYDAVASMGILGPSNPLRPLQD